MGNGLDHPSDVEHWTFGHGIGAPHKGRAYGEGDGRGHDVCGAPWGDGYGVGEGSGCGWGSGRGADHDICNANSTGNGKGNFLLLKGTGIK